jgi:hypothetical protein
VFPVRYELNSYILFGRNSVFKGLSHIILRLHCMCLIKKTTHKMFYYCFRLHNSWYRYTIRFSFSTCFGLMGSSSGTLGLTVTYFVSCYCPYSGQCLHIRSALCVRFLCPLTVARQQLRLLCGPCRIKVKSRLVLPRTSC